MIQLNQIQLPSQTPSHVEITKMLSTIQPESRIIECQCQKLISVSSVDWCKVDETRAINFEEKLARLSSKINNIHDTKNEVFRIYLINVSKSQSQCE